MDGRGQISIEVVFFIAIVVVIVLVFASIMGDQNEQNMVSSAVKLGAENATTNMVITNTGITPVRVTSISMSGDNNINITVHFSNSVSNMQDQILESINKSLTVQGYPTWYNSTNQTSVPLETKRHLYNITLNYP